VTAERQAVLDGQTESVQAECLHLGQSQEVLSKRQGTAPPFYDEGMSLGQSEQSRSISARQELCLV